MEQSLHLEPLGRFPGLRVLAWCSGRLYAGRGYRLYRWQENCADWQRVASFSPSWSRRLSSLHPLSARLRRDGYHALVELQDGALVAVLPGVIAQLPPGAGEFRATFRIPRGTRPLSLAATPDGHVFWGEYFDNPAREAVHIYGSGDGGHTWRIRYTFPPKSIRHIHSITYDPHGDCLWILTGDLDAECRLLRAAPDFSSMEVVLAGSQQNRAVTLLPLPEAVYFATDSPFEQNYVYSLRGRGHLQQLAPIKSSSFFSARTGGAMFFSTVVEPSPVNDNSQAHLYGSADGRNFATLLSWPRDALPLKFFQYPNILLPAGENETAILALTGLAVRGEDQVTHLYRVKIG